MGKQAFLTQLRRDAMTFRATQTAWSILAATAASACEHENPLPDVVATSKYIEYSTEADDAIICMDDRLARLDAFIEDAAAFLEVPPPAQKIRYGCGDPRTRASNLRR